MTKSHTSLKRPGSAEIQYNNMRFLITSCPTDANLDHYIEELQRCGVRDVVRVCEPRYNTNRLTAFGISVMDWQFDDGCPPPSDVVSEWFHLLKSRFMDEPGSCVAVHCVGGLGRAPVLVAVALIESGMKYEEAVELIRNKRRGAINAKQLAYLRDYRPKSRLKTKSSIHKQCLIM